MAFRFDKLTVKAQEAVAAAQSLAREQGHPDMDSLHLLSALLNESEGIVQPLLAKVGVNRRPLESMVRREVERMPRVRGGSTAPPNAEPQQVLDAAAT